jgi:hypothetical protein
MDGISYNTFSPFVKSSGTSLSMAYDYTAIQWWVHCMVGATLTELLMESMQQKQTMLFNIYRAMGFWQLRSYRVIQQNVAPNHHRHAAVPITLYVCVYESESYICMSNRQTLPVSCFVWNKESSIDVLTICWITLNIQHQCPTLHTLRIALMTNIKLLLVKHYQLYPVWMTG